jgi:hypothetical protein
VSPEPSGGFRMKNRSLSCLDVPSLGAPARVVCSDRNEGVDALAPYMARGLPTASFGSSEVHLQLVAEPLRRRYGAQLALVRTVGVPFALRELSLDHPKFDRALRDSLYGFADELIALAYDLDRLDVDVTLADGNALDVGSSLSLLGQRSFLGQELVRAAGQGGPPIDAFWKLPANVQAASYSSFSDPEHFKPVAASLRDLADGWLDYEGLPDARRAPLVSALEQALTNGGKSAYATFPADASPSTAADHTEHLKESLRASLGNGVLVVDRGGDAIAKLVSEAGKSLADRSFREHLVKAKLLESPQIPTLRERASKGAKGLPAGSKTFELTIPAAAFESGGKGSAGSAKKSPLSFVLLAVPDGTSTWFGFGTDEKSVVSRIVEARSGSGELLDHRDGLASLRSETALSAGFSSVAAIVSGARGHLGDDGLGDPKNLDRLPHRGETPILWRAGAEPRGPRATVSARLPRAVLEDLVALTASQAARVGHP